MIAIVEATENSTMRLPQPPTTTPMIVRVSASASDDVGPVAVSIRVAKAPIMAAPRKTDRNVAMKAVARCRSDAQGQPGHDAASDGELVEVGHLAGHGVGGGLVHPAGDPAVDQEDHRVGVRRRDRVVGDHHDGLAEGVDAVAQQGEHVAGGRGVEGAGRLVGEHDGGVGDQRPGDRDPLLLAAGQRAREVPAAVAEADPVEQVADPVAVRPVAGQAQREADVLLGGEVGHQVEALEDEADPLAAQPGAVVLVPVGDVLAVDEDPAVGRPLEAGRAVEERRLAGAGRAHDGGEGAGREGEVDTGERGDRAGSLAVGPGQAADLECG